MSVLPGCFIDIKTTEGIFTTKRLKISQLYRSMEGNLRKWIPDSNPLWDSRSLSCIPDSKAQDSGFCKQNFRRFWNPDSLTWGELYV